MRFRDPIRVGAAATVWQEDGHATPTADRLPPDVQLRRCRVCQHWLTSEDRRAAGHRWCKSCGADQGRAA